VAEPIAAERGSAVLWVLEETDGSSHLRDHLVEFIACVCDSAYSSE
jgi:hypothetical protein